MWHLQTWRCVSSKVADLWSQVALRDQGFAIGSMSVQIEGAVDVPTQAEEGCCGGDDEQKCTGVARVLLLYDEAFKHDYASGHKRRVLAGV